MYTMLSILSDLQDAHAVNSMTLTATPALHSQPSKIRFLNVFGTLLTISYRCFITGV